MRKHPAAADKCAGQDLQLEVTATGTPPLHYRWYQNNTPLADTDSSSLRLNNLQTGQSGNYFCRVYSSRGDSVNSNTVNVLVRATVTPAVSITSDTLRYCPGAPALFKADIVNGGSNPTLQWLINGIASGGTGLSFSTDQLHNDDQVQAVLRSNATCASPESASSNILTVQVVFCTINNIADVQPGFRFSVFPNPARSHFTLKLPEMSGSVYQLRILNAFGQLIQTENIKGSQVEIMLRPASKGMLFLQLSDANGRTATAKLMVE